MIESEIENSIESAIGNLIEIAMPNSVLKMR